jgi:hypothetical protein
MEKEFTEQEVDRIIEMAWKDRTPFEAIAYQFELTEKEVIKIMRKPSKSTVSSYGVKGSIAVLAKNTLKDVVQI